jgi:hypothetical protein
MALRLYEQQPVTVMESYIEGRVPRNVSIDIKEDDTVSAMITWRRVRQNEDGTIVLLGDAFTDIPPERFPSFFARFIVDDPSAASLAESRERAIAEWVAAEQNGE